VEILGKVENLVCRILPSFSTGNENGFGLVPADSVAISKIYNWDGQTLYCFEACRVLTTRAIA
jgi:hypothetical protein